jgi:CubicO group peptidase (beta-lactamase class C family)
MGVSIAIVDDQKIVWSQGFGYADVKNNLPATSETVYRIGSISKLFTVMATMQLAEQGKVDIDQPLKKYLPQFSVKTRFPDSGPITLRACPVGLQKGCGLPRCRRRCFFGSKMNMLPIRPITFWRIPM